MNEKINIPRKNQWKRLDTKPVPIESIPDYLQKAIEVFENSSNKQCKQQLLDAVGEYGYRCYQQGFEDRGD